jgi:steroid delta-isomerase-like uncharacterized protein
MPGRYGLFSMLTAACYSLALLILAGAGCSPATEPSVQEKNKEVVRRIWEEVVNRGDVEMADQFIASDYVCHTPGGNDLHGIDEGFVRPLETLRLAFPDLECSLDDIIAEDDLVVHRWSAAGTHQGDYAGVPATGVRVVMTGIIMSRFEMGKVAEDWAETDELGILQQLGRFPPRENDDYGWGRPPATGGERCTTVMSRKLYLTELEDVWKEKDTGAVERLYAPAFVDHDPVSPEIVDRDDYAGWVSSWHDRAPDMQIVLEELVAEGDRAAGRWTALWTDTGGIAGVPPSGKELRMSGLDIIRCAGGAIAERWWAEDVLGVLRQAGIFPGDSMPEEEPVTPE